MVDVIFLIDFPQLISATRNILPRVTGCPANSSLLSLTTRILFDFIWLLLFLSYYLACSSLFVDGTPNALMTRGSCTLWTVVTTR
jgi:hypothetical protein